MGERNLGRPQRVADVFPCAGDESDCRPGASTDHDYGRQDVIIIDETLAARAWPGKNPIGRRLQVQPTGNPNAFAEVIDVVEHIRMHDLARAVRPQIYSPSGAAGGCRSWSVPPAIPALSFPPCAARCGKSTRIRRRPNPSDARLCGGCAGRVAAQSHPDVDVWRHRPAAVVSRDLPRRLSTRSVSERGRSGCGWRSGRLPAESGTWFSGKQWC